jgi:CHAT domain
MTGSTSTRVLMLQTASPHRGMLDTPEEHRQVLQAVRAARYPDALDFEIAQACRAEDLADHLLRTDPSVLHFSGHCTPDGGLRFQTDNGDDAPVSNEGLVDLIAETGITLALLNGCHTARLAERLADVTGCAIGIDGPINDSTAIASAREFYRAVAYGCSIGQAFRRARAALRTLGMPHDELPTLHTREGSDADTLFLIPPRHLAPPPRDSTKPNATAVLARNRKQTFTALVTGHCDTEDEARDMLTNVSTGDLQVRYIQINDTV